MRHEAGRRVERAAALRLLAVVSCSLVGPAPWSVDATSGVTEAPPPRHSYCFKNCTQLVVEHGFLVQGENRTWIGTNWSSIAAMLDQHMPTVGQLPGLDANASTMRSLTLTGDYIADVPLNLPSRLYFNLNGSVRGNLTHENQGPLACPYGLNPVEYGMCAIVEIGPGVSFVSVTGGTYTCDDPGGTSFAVSCRGCSNTLIQNLTASGCGRQGIAPGGNINFYGAGPAVEVRNIESFGSNRGIWHRLASQKVLITDSYLHDNVGDGVDLDSFSQHVMVRRCRLENNQRCGVFMEEGASNNIVIDNTMVNNTYGVSFFTDLDGKDPGMYPTKDNWVIGNTFHSNRNAISLGGMRGNGATDNLIAESTIVGNNNGWWCNNALVGNHVLTSDTKDNNYLEGSKYCKSAQTDANVSFFAEPPQQ